MQKKIAIYARQSVDKKDSLSIETQIEYCRNSINSKPNDLPIEVYKDKGYSGKNTFRPDFQRLITDISEDAISKIVVYKLDRISRNLLDFTTMYKTFQDHSVEFCSVNETFDTSTATGRAMLKISMVFAEMERETIQMRVKDNYYQRIKVDGRWAGGPAPYGYINSRTHDRKPTLSINPSEIEAIPYIFEAYANRDLISLQMLGNELYDKGYRSRRENGRFDNVTIARILQNPVYCKADETLYKYYAIRQIQFLNSPSDWNGSTSAHIVGKRAGNSNTRKYANLKEQSIYLTNIPGIIDSTTFIKVQDRLARNEQLKRKNQPTNMKEFQGLLKCAKCGYSIKMYTKPYLACYGNYTLKCCTAKFSGIRIEHLQQALSEEMQEKMSKLAKEVTERILIQNSLDKKIESLNKEISNLIDLIARLGDKAPEVAELQISEKQEKIRELELEKSLNTNLAYQPIPIKWNRLTEQQKKTILHQYLEKMDLRENGELRLYWK